ncbi:MAG: M23 family metallopeptidase [Flammeovirgaceae bacterium]|nr:MAG: M23 family metallopeptidase [Flammeovirgaceae bacterium]
MVYVQARYFTTETTLGLRAENKALQKHFTLLSSELKSLDAVLAGITATEKIVEKKLFNDRAVTNSTNKTVIEFPTGMKEAKALLKSLKDRVSLSLHKAAEHNYRYIRNLNLTTADKNTIAGWPSGQPVSKTHLKITSGFGMRIHPFHKGLYPHQGIDIVAPKGIPVYVTGSGKVMDTGKNNLEAGYGNYVEVDHGNGIITRYAHLHDITVNAGQFIQKGTIIGTIGTSGGAAAPHLHYEVLRDGEQVNPLFFMMDGLTSAAYAQLTQQAEKKNQSLD